MVRCRIDPYVETPYSQAWSRLPPTTFSHLLDTEHRRGKAVKILAVVEDFVDRPLAGLRCLDLGCSAGGIAAVLAERFGEVVGLDPDTPAIELARQRHRAPNLRFEAGTLGAAAERLGRFDVVVCNHVYEHVHDQRGLADAIWRALGDDGCCYFSAGNALMLREGHYGLPFLSWLPADLASAYLRLARRGDWYRERHLTLWGLRRLLRGFRAVDYTVPILADPDRFAAGEFRLPVPRPLVGPLARVAYALIPTYVWMLTRR